MKTTITSVSAASLGTLRATQGKDDYLDQLAIELDQSQEDAKQLQGFALQLQQSDVPIAFPTETVYGLGADATRSEAVKGIYKAKQRPSDNPLIVHFSSLQQIRKLLNGNEVDASHQDPIPAIYQPLIEKFWPGPLTIILPNPEDSKLAPEVTAGLSTFGARIPRHPIALALIQLADRPIAAPSANASTKPSPTAAEHVAYDLDGRIESIIDGGPCEVGVESTVVDGLSKPPLVLRPGGISIEQIRGCPGWHDVAIGYKDIAEKGDKPRAPGMKYRHYSPRARVVLYQSGTAPPSSEALVDHTGESNAIGIIRSVSWQCDLEGTLSMKEMSNGTSTPAPNGVHGRMTHHSQGFQRMLDSVRAETNQRSIQRRQVALGGRLITVLDIHLGSTATDMAKGIFSALRELDRENVSAIVVEGIDESNDDLAAAVMNRLKKAAETTV